jgi:L-alanine-DL-glutamate epimerase-like enolase superfamily enzyme
LRYCISDSMRYGIIAELLLIDDMCRESSSEVGPHIGQVPYPV